MAKHSNLSNARNAKNDEFYTRLNDVENEMQYYKNQFKDMVVYCNCDDARESNFFKYFSLNFEFLGLKKLIATAYKENGRGVILTYEGDKNGNRMVDDEEIKVTELQGDGDFRSEECIELLKQADIVVTNPPFSLFREYIATLMQYGKKFIILGNNNAISYKEVFPYIKNGQLWLGHNSNKTIEFTLPNTYLKWKRIENNKKIGSVPAISWFTNMETNKQIDAPMIINKYNENDYPKYDNYDAINVDKVKDMPYDYDGVIGVPITIADKICSDGYVHFDCPMLPQRDLKYQIVGCADADIIPQDWNGMSKKFVDLYYQQGNKGCYKEGNRLACYIDMQGNAKVPYKRILIQKVK